MRSPVLAIRPVAEQSERRVCLARKKTRWKSRRSFHAFHRRSTAHYTAGFWIELALGLLVAILGWVLLHWGYGWVLDGHARAAVAMFVFLAIAALAYGGYGVHARHNTGHLVLWDRAH